MKMRSLLALVPLLSFSSCVVEYRDHYYDDPYYDDDGGYACSSAVVKSGVIDPDDGLAIDPGQGAGVFVEYQRGGHWHITTTCDTDRSGYDCEFDIIATPVDGRTLSTSPDDFERDDWLEITSGESVHFIAFTARDTDGVYIDTDPGAVLSLDVLLDRDCGNPFVYWVGDGAIHEGAPTNPFEFVPAKP